MTAPERELREQLADMRALMCEVLSEFEREPEWGPDSEVTGHHHEATVSGETFERWLKLARIEAL